MLWKCIKTNGWRKMIKMDGSLNSARYIQFLINLLMPNLDKAETFWHDDMP